jgi:mRNA-degrading endonuclease toxin of MazEF toxin-antitoxin module
MLEFLKIKNMTKKFDEWNEQKKKVESKLKPQYIHDGEVWMSYVGVNIGTESDGVGLEFMRPVVILKRVRFQQIWVVPLSTQNNEDYILLNFAYKGKINYANILQLKTLDTARLGYNMGKASEEDLLLIKQKICNTLGMQI